MDKPDCESNKVFYPDRCFNRLEFDTSQRDDVMSGRMKIFGLSCRCYELNCTAEMAEFEFEFRPNPPSPNETTPTCEFTACVCYVLSTHIHKYNTCKY